MTGPRTICEAFQLNAARDPNAVALRTPGDKVTITWGEYRDRVQSIASGLANLGVAPGDTVALMLTNRPEFHLCDTAVLHTGATPFSMYNTNPPEVLAHLFTNADNRIVISERQFLPQIQAAQQLGGQVKHVICVDEAPEGTLSLADVEAAPAPDFDFEATWRAVKPEDLLTIVYTSGTTGPPKGVELTHTNFIENARVIDEFGSVSSADRVISYLPDAHAANRWFSHYGNLLKGLQITDVADAKQVLDALTDVRPTVFLGVPRVWVKMKAGIEAAVAGAPSPVARYLGQWALGVGRTVARRSSEGRSLGPLLAAQHAVADRLVLTKIRSTVGLDQVRVGITGAAPIPPEVHEFILGLGISVCEAWGLSESTAGATANRPGRIKIGTVGFPLPDTEIRLADDGEVLVRGPQVMRGYRKEPEKTSEAIDHEGWLHTGDIGTIDADGYLTIIDRKKELIINAAGKNMSPTNIENTITAHCTLVGPVAAIGEQRQYNTALITLDPEAIAAFAKQHNLPSQDLAALAGDATVRAEIQAGIDAANAKLSRVEQIKKFTILPDVWEPGGTHLTPKGTLKRKPIATDYAAVIDAMY